LEIGAEDRGKVIFRSCQIGSLVIGDYDQVFDPVEITNELTELGCEFEQEGGGVATIQQKTPDEDLRLAERTLRAFLRATQLNENVFRQKLGARFSKFEADVLPELLGHGVLQEVAYLGSGSQRRFRLTVPMQSIQRALSECGGDFNAFLAKVRE